MQKAIVNVIASIKKRRKPDNLLHPSVGTTGQFAMREADKDTIRNLKLSRDTLSPLLLSPDLMINLGYALKIPQGAGGDEPTLEGLLANCDRCGNEFTVKGDAGSLDCCFHWGKLYSIKVPGEKEKKRILSCCSQDKSSKGCAQGPHVFYEKEYDTLHLRFPFLAFEEHDRGLEVVAVDCEMIYTTAGMRLAHVSVIDGAGNVVLDEPVRLEEDVKVM